MAEHYFLFPFGIDGDLTAIPNPTQVSGSVSYEQGFPIGYEEANTAPGYLPVPRNQFNQLMNDITTALQQLQQTGFPSFITSAANGGTPFPYGLGAEVWSAGVPYRSLIANNTDTPPTSNWAIIGQNRSLYFNYAIDTGTANHYAISPNPAMSSYTDGNVIELRPAFGNTGACDINVNGLGIVPIKTLQNQDPIGNMIIPAGVYTLAYNSNTSCFVLQNPALGTAAYYNAGTSANNILQLNGSAQIPAVSGALLTNILSGIAGASGIIVFQTLGITIQWGTTPNVNDPTVTFPTAYSATPWYITATSKTAAVGSFYISAESSTQMTIITGEGSASYYWLAIGPT